MKSELARFHNQKDNDFDPETMVVYEPGIKKHDKKIIERERENKNQETRGNLETEKHLKYIVELINNISPDKLYEKDIQQAKLLEQKQLQAKKLIINALRSVEEYMSSIKMLDSTKLSRESVSQDNYLKDLENSDRARTIKHNALISDINIANRFILNNFGNMEEENIEEWEEKEEEGGRKVLYAKRIDFPRNIICTDRVNMEDRKQIADWAIEIYKSLSELKKELSQ
ncbi:MAG: hypothetical protein WCV59_01220 [Parcubacteria group bacterium]|jgi:hypothetical protein